MSEIEVFVFLLGVIALLVAVGRRIDVPYPIVLVLGGLGLGFVPGLPAPQIDPDIVLFVFLPPLAVLRGLLLLGLRAARQRRADRAAGRSASCCSPSSRSP